MASSAARHRVLWDTDRRRAKRARSQSSRAPELAHHLTLPLVTGSSPNRSDEWRDWANGLSAGPAGLIAERVLSDDVAGYVRFRTVCAAWRASCADPRARRLRPRSSSSDGSRRAFLNASTGESIHVRLPDLRRGHYLFGPTAEGLVLLCRRDTLAVELHNPLTGQRASLPRATSLLFPTSASNAYRIDDAFSVRSAGIAGGSAVALHYGRSAVAVARPGDECWTQLGRVDKFKSAVSFAGRFYCVTFESISVLEAAASQPPRLVVAVDLKPHCGRFLWSDMVHLVDKDGELVLVHCALHPTSTNYCGRYTAYRVNLDKRDMVAIPRLGLSERDALFMGMDRSISMRATAVSPSVAAGTVYVCFKYDRETGRSKVVAVDSLGRCSEPNFPREDIASYLSRYVSA